MTTCPKCGATTMVSVKDGDQLYLCGTLYSGGRCDSQSPRCYRDQLARQLWAATANDACEKVQAIREEMKEFYTEDL